MIRRRVRLLCFAIFLAALASFASAAPSARIVRLSVAQGDVQIDRNSGAGWEQALNNMPVIGGARIFAGDNSKAEVEFEDGSTVRLAGPAQIALKDLSFSAAGAPITHIEIDSGLVYVDAHLKDRADFRIVTSTGESFAITQPSRLRFKVGEQVASLSVTEGEVQVLSDSGNSTLRAGQSYNYVLGQPDSSVRSATVPQQSDDTWNQQRETYNDQNSSAVAQYSGGDDQNAPGVADLSNYGAYDNVPDCGDCWQPAGVGPDWNPYDNGAWSYYNNWGWTFVSAYPWGWTPYYYGSWFYVGGRGWWWRPGPRHGPYGFGGFHPLPLVARAPNGFSAPHPPAQLSHSTVAVAGSNVRVGPITETHATMATRTAAAGAASVAVPHASPGATSNMVHSPTASTHGAPLISGEKGTYRLSNPTAGGRYGFQVDREAAGATPRAGGYSSPSPRTYAGSSSPRPYAYAGSSAPRTYSAPSAPIEPASSAPPAGFAPHSSGGGAAIHESGGGGFHGGGGGGFHGGGGGGHR